MDAAGWDSKTEGNLGGELLDLTVFLGISEWSSCFGIWRGLKDCEKHREKGGGEGMPGALWNPYKLPSCSLAPPCISLSTFPEQAPPLGEAVS